MGSLMPELHVIAHDIRSRENVGALFRTADALGVTKLWLTGYTPHPPDPKIAKVALGAEKSVVFEVQADIEKTLVWFQEQNIPIFALELSPGAQDLRAFVSPTRLGLLLGTERTGIPPSLLERCAGVIQIKQFGKKESLNVAIAAGIAIWAIKG